MGCSTGTASYSPLGPDLAASRDGTPTATRPTSAAVIGAWRGFKRLPDRFKRGVRYGDTISGTGYTLRRAINSTVGVARRVTEMGGGAAGKTWSLPESPVLAPLLEQWPLTPDPAPKLQASASQAATTVTFDATARPRRHRRTVVVRGPRLGARRFARPHLPGPGDLPRHGLGRGRPRPDERQGRGRGRARALAAITRR